MKSARNTAGISIYDTVIYMESTTNHTLWYALQMVNVFQRISSSEAKISQYLSQNFWRAELFWLV